MTSSEKSISTSRPLSRLEMLALKAIPIPAEEVERRRLAVEALKERLSSIPSFAAKAKANPRYWEILHGSRINT